MPCPMFVPCPFSERLENQFLQARVITRAWEINKLLFFNEQEQRWYCSARNCPACPAAQEEPEKLLDFFSLSSYEDERNHKTNTKVSEASRFACAETLGEISAANSLNQDAHVDEPVSLRKLVQTAKDFFQRGKKVGGP